MPTATSHLQYPALRKILDKIIDEDLPGAQLTVQEYGMAIRLRQQIYSIRKAEREKYKRIYQPGDARWGTCPYDALSVSLKTAPDGRHIVMIVGNSLPTNVEVSYLEEPAAEPAIEPTPAEPADPAFKDIFGGEE